MKKYLLYSLLLSIIVISCSTKADDYENSAKKQIKNVMKKVAKNPDTFRISDIETAYKLDSICVIRFVGIGENSFGGHNSSKYEFVMLSHAFDTNEQVTICSLADLENSKSVLINYKNLGVKLPEGKNSKDDSIYVYCSLQVFKSKGLLYNGIVKELTKDRRTLEAAKEAGI